MTTQTEALKMALEALNTNRVMAKDSEGNYTREITPKLIVEAITAIKESLAQPEQLEGLQLIHKADIDLAKKRATEAQPEKHELLCVCGCTWEIDANGNEELISSPPQPKKREQEPVAWPMKLPWDNNPEKHPQFYTWTWDEMIGGGKWRAEYGWKKPERQVTNLQALYTTPPQPENEVRGNLSRKPLTDDEAFELIEQDYQMEEYAQAALQLIRRTEAAHGIKGEE